MKEAAIKFSWKVGGFFRSRRTAEEEKTKRYGHSYSSVIRSFDDLGRTWDGGVTSFTVHVTQ